jgi:hypothetical protein
VRRSQSAQKMAKNWWRMCKNTKIEIWQYIVGWWEPCWQKKNQFEKEISKIRCLWTQLNFIECLIARKVDFKVNLGFNWKQLKFWGQIIIFENWFGQIKGLIEVLSQLGAWLKKSETKG